jgi:hypothetical protein
MCPHEYPGLYDSYGADFEAFYTKYETEGKGKKQLNKEIFETLYYASMTASKDLAKVDGAYESYDGSPVSQGIFQYDMWGLVLQVIVGNGIS